MSHLSTEAKFHGNVGYMLDLTTPTCAFGEKVVCAANHRYDLIHFSAYASAVMRIYKARSGADVSFACIT
jgi:hypothetical protein